MHKIILLLIAISLLGCAGPRALIKRGSFEKALELTSKRLQKGNDRKETIDAFLLTFNALNIRDFALADHHCESRSWVAAFPHFQKIQERQAKYRAAIVKVKTLGRSEEVHYLETDELVREVRRKCAQHYFEHAEPLFESAEEGNLEMARQAYGLIDSALYYQADFPGGARLLQQLFDQAVIGILIKPYSIGLENERQEEVLRQLINPKSYPQQRGWTLYFLADSTPTVVDAVLEIEVHDFQVGSNNESASTCCQSETICTGTKTEKVWSEKDSCHVEVKEPVYEDLSVTVTTYERSKKGSFSAHCKLLDAITSEKLDAFVLRAKATWSNTYSTYSGDREALGGSCDTASDTEESFPSDLIMLKRAARRLGRRLLKEIEMQRKII